MKEPLSPLDEDKRLTTLRSLNILDTLPEERFDRLTRLAKRMFNVPIALVSLVDEHRQWFKSSVGLNATETPRNISFCGHSILDDEIMVVPDTFLDHRFSDNPLVTDDPNIRFYAGCPIRHTNGHKLGTLCIIDREPKELNQDDLEALKDLAELTEHEIAAAQLATLDDLTEISNRRGFALLAKKSLEICKRNKLPISVVYFDLNRFKSINDTYGHAAGDTALKAFSNMMRAAFRDSDVIARISGDEFVALLTNTEEANVSTIINRLQNLVTQFNDTTAEQFTISFSSGIATTEVTDALSVEELLDSADKAMYSNK